MLFECKNGCLSLTHLSCISKEEVCFDLYLGDNAIDYMEIGGEHLLCNDHMHRVIDGSKKMVDATLSIIAEKVADQKTSGDDSERTYFPIGEATFFPANDDFENGLLAYKVSIPPASFETLKQAVIYGKTITHLYFDLEEIELGWEPDGSHQIWSIKEKSLSSSPFFTAKIIKIAYQIF